MHDVKCGALLLQAQVGPARDAVRVSGRDVMTGLKGALGRLLPMPDMAPFRAAVASLDEAIEAGMADVTAHERGILVALRAPLGGLLEALTTLATELDQASDQASRRAGSSFRYEFVADQQK